MITCLMLIAGICAAAHAYSIQIEKGPVLDAGPNTYLGASPIAEGTPLMRWLGGATNISRILIGTPQINADQMDFSETLVRSRFEEAMCADSLKGKWHYAPYTMGTVYMTGGDKINFAMHLSGISIGGHLFTEPRDQDAEQSGGGYGTPGAGSPSPHR